VLHLLRNNSPYTAILLFIVTLGINMQSLLHAELPVATSGQVLYGWIISGFAFMLGKSAFAFGLVTVVMIYLQALLLNAVAMSNRLFGRNTYLVAYSYLLLCAANPAFSHFNPQVMVNWLLIFAIQEILRMQQLQHPNKTLFNIGFLLMMAALVQFSAVFLLVFLFTALIILRPFSMKEWAIALSGMLMPLYIIAVVLFLTDKLPLLLLWPDVGISLPRQIHPAVYYLGSFAFVLVFFATGVFNMQGQLPKTSIYIRRCWIALSALFLFTLLTAVFTEVTNGPAWLVSLPALSLIVAHAFYNERSRLMNNIVFYCSLAFVVFCQFFLPV
jgi:hypothetical protein